MSDFNLKARRGVGGREGVLLVFSRIGGIVLIAVVFNFCSMFMCNVLWVLVLLILQWAVALHTV